MAGKLWKALTVDQEEDVIKSCFQDVKDRLLNGLLYFQPPSASALEKLKKEVKDQLTLKFLIDISQMLNLDEMQTWAVFKEFVESPRVNALNEQLKSFISDQLKDTTLRTAFLQQVCSFYFEERLLLLQCQQYLLSHSDQESVKDLCLQLFDAKQGSQSKFFAQTVKALTEASLDKFLLDVLSSSSSTSSSMANGSAKSFAKPANETEPQSSKASFTISQKSILFMQVLREQLEQLRVLALLQQHFLMTDADIKDLCNVYDLPICRGFSSMRNTSLLTRVQADYRTLISEIRALKVLLLLQAMQLNSYEDMLLDLVMRVREAKPLEDCLFVLYLKSMQPLSDAANRWCKQRKDLLTMGTSRMDVEDALSLVLVSSILMTWAYAVQVAHAYLLDAKNALGAALDVATLASFDDSNSRFLHLQHLYLLREIISRSVTPGFAPQPWIQLVQMLRLTTENTTEVHKLTHVYLRDEELAYISEGAALSAYHLVELCLLDFPQVDTEEFDAIVSLLGSALAFLPDQTHELFTGQPKQERIAMLLAQHLDSFPHRNLSVVHTLLACCRADTHANKSTAAMPGIISAITSMFANMTGFTWASSLNDEQILWARLTPAESEREDMDVVALRNFEINFGGLVMPVTAGTLGRVVTTNQEQQAILIQWQTSYSGWFFLLRLAQDGLCGEEFMVADAVQFTETVVRLLTQICNDRDSLLGLQEHLVAVTSAIHQTDEHSLLTCVLNILKTAFGAESPPLSLITACLEFLQAYADFYPFIIWQRLQDEGLFMSQEVATPLRSILFNYEQREGIYSVTAAYIELVTKMFAMAHVVTDHVTPIDWSPMLPMAQFLLREIFRDHIIWFYKEPTDKQALAVRILRLARSILATRDRQSGPITAECKSMNRRLSAQLLEDVLQNPQFASTIFAHAGKGHETIEEMFATWRHLEAQLTLKLLSDGLHVIRTALRTTRNDDADHPSAVELLFLHSQGSSGPTAEFAGSLSRHHRQQHSMIFTLASLVKTTRSIDIPVASTRILTDLCQSSARWNVASLAGALGPHLPDLRDCFLRRLEDPDSSAEILTVIFKFLKEVARTQPSLARQFVDFKRKPILKGSTAAKTSGTLQYGERSFIPKLLKVLEGRGQWLSTEPALYMSAMELVGAVWTSQTSSILRQSKDFWATLSFVISDAECMKSPSREEAEKMSKQDRYRTCVVIPRCQAIVLSVVMLEAYTTRSDETQFQNTRDAAVSFAKKLPLAPVIIDEQTGIAVTLLMTAWCDFCTTVFAPPRYQPAGDVQTVTIDGATVCDLCIRLMEGVRFSLTRLSDEVEHAMQTQSKAGWIHAKYFRATAVDLIDTLLVLLHRIAPEQHGFKPEDTTNLFKLAFQVLDQACAYQAETGLLRTGLYGVIMTMVSRLIPVGKGIPEDIGNICSDMFQLVWRSLGKDMANLSDAGLSANADVPPTSASKESTLDVPNVRDAGLALLEVLLRHAVDKDSIAQMILEQGAMADLINRLTTALTNQVQSKFVMSSMHFLMTASLHSSTATALCSTPRIRGEGGLMTQLTQAFALLWEQHRLTKIMDPYTSKDGDLASNVWFNAWRLFIELESRLLLHLGHAWSCMSDAIRFLSTFEFQLDAVLHMFLGQRIQLQQLELVNSVLEFLVQLARHKETWLKAMPALLNPAGFLALIAEMYQHAVHLARSPYRCNEFIVPVTTAEKDMQAKDKHSVTPLTPTETESQVHISQLGLKCSELLMKIIANSSTLLRLMTTRRHLSEPADLAATVCVFATEMTTSTTTPPSLGTLLSCMDYVSRSARKHDESRGKDKLYELAFDNSLRLFIAQTLWYQLYQPDTLHPSTVVTHLNTRLRHDRAPLSPSPSTTMPPSSPVHPSRLVDSENALHKLASKYLETLSQRR
eukprot:m.200542 g.200542  ORF g.200542 m.200542 type:complete len:1896 (+) comp16856_c4_seq1:256-5943(+)